MIGRRIYKYIYYMFPPNPLTFCESDDRHRLPRIMNQRESIPEYARLGESVDFFPLNSHNNLHLFFLSFFFFCFQRVFFFSFLFFSFFLGRNSGLSFQFSPKKNLIVIIIII